MLVDIILPAWGEHHDGGATMINWLVAPGDLVSEGAAGGGEADKVTFEPPSPVAGTATEITAPVDQPVAVSSASPGSGRSPHRAWRGELDLRLRHQHSAVDVDDLASDVVTLRAQKEHHRRRDVIG